MLLWCVVLEFEPAHFSCTVLCSAHILSWYECVVKLSFFLQQGKTHTVLTCVSASGYALPPFMIYPRRITDNLKVGALPSTSFHHSDSGWVNAELLLKWFESFVRMIPPFRPVLLILDGHASHIIVDVVELAWKNDIHMLWLPANTTHILQSLDVEAFKSLKNYYYKACKKHITEHPGRVVTMEVIASLLATAWPQAVTPVNVMAWILGRLLIIKLHLQTPLTWNRRNVHDQKRLVHHYLIHNPRLAPIFNPSL